MNLALKLCGFVFVTLDYFSRAEKQLMLLQSYDSIHIDKSFDTLFFNSIIK